jgi:sugar/nucleoside kinase (ribokinase family)
VKHEQRGSGDVVQGEAHGSGVATVDRASLESTLDLVCVSYLAYTQVLGVAIYPAANGGAVVDRIAASIGADGPLTTVTAARLGLRVGLIANAVGADDVGHRMLDWLDSYGIRHGITAVADHNTPELTVVVDDSGTRTWFALLREAATELTTANLHLIADARITYVDCYEIIRDAAIRAIMAAKASCLVLNLGGEPPDERVIEAARHRNVIAVQASCDESEATEAAQLAEDLFMRTNASVAIVTIGRLGAVAFDRAGLHRASAPPVRVTHTHGAGAAFSAGYIYAILNGADTPTALREACESGAAHCATPSAEVPPHPPHNALLTSVNAA